MAAIKREKRNSINDAKGALSFDWLPRVYHESDYSTPSEVTGNANVTHRAKCYLDMGTPSI
jgi:hypothetical protein